ncbi:hypothetical protein [Priestia megaterium]|uniref:Uncharacterized protein n=1 Tax=Priestia megaterium TaxID=1404 RepID=A0A6M6E908_PRIMG|nr:hypothetical protein [Priestia megaterium]QJX80908.1 hypothetical protein FDZ14_32985 [Priestia megaterium]
MEKCIEKSEESRKEKSDFNRKNYDYKKVDKNELAALLYNLENLFTFIKMQSKLFAHIIAYFLVVCILSFAAYFFTEQIEAIPMGFIVVGNTFILLYGIWLLFLGIKQCIKNDKYLKMLMKHIQDVRRVLQNKDEQN